MLDSLLNNWMVVAAGVAMILLIVLVRVLGGPRDLPYLIVTDFSVRKSPSDGRYVVLEGRPEGLSQVLLRLFGFATTIRFEITTLCAQRSTKGRHQYILESIPLGSVGSTRVGLSKSTAYAVAGGILVVLGLVAVILAAASIPPLTELPGPAQAIIIFGCEIAGLIMFWGFSLSQRIVLAVETGGGELLGVQFKPSLVGNSKVDFTTAFQTADIINNLRSGNTFSLAVE